MNTTTTDVSTNTDEFFREYTSQDAILKYIKATAGFGISHLLDHDYKTVYLEAIDRLPQSIRQDEIWMRLWHEPVAPGFGFEPEWPPRRARNRQGFSPVLIDAANKEAQSYITPQQRSPVQFCVAKNERLFEVAVMAYRDFSIYTRRYPA
jgi:hypothetical protein